MATSTPVALFNTDPNVQSQAALLQQRQAMAQALLNEGMKPLDLGSRSVGGVGYNISPMEGLAKMLQAYSGRKGLENTTQQQAGLAAQAYASLLNKYQPGQATYSDQQRSDAEVAGMPGQGTDGVGPPDPQKYAAALMGQQPANQNTNPNNPNGIPAELIASYTAGMVPKEVFEAQAARYKPTDATVTALQGGMDPTQANRTQFAFANTDPKVRAMQQAGLTPQQIQQAIAAEAQKNATMEGRPGQSLYTFNGSGPPQLTAVSPDPNSNMQFSVNGGRVSAQPVPGAVPNKSNMAGGTAGASANATTNNTLHMVTMPDGSQRPIRGSEVPALSPQPGVQGRFRGDPAQIQQAIAEIKDPQERANAQAAFEAQIRAEGNPVKLGQSTAAKVGDTNQMEGMQQRFAKLQSANEQAQTTSSYLRSIKDLAPAAATGRFSDKLQYVNSLLSTVGNEKATDATTANNLLDKYSNQIVARLGQGGLGTDAARAILQSAYPNAHMTKEAIAEAADNLIGAQEMTMAKSRLLSPHGNAKDPVSYQQKEQVFDQNADPRMWQYAAIKDATQRKAFLQRVLKNDPTFLQRAEQLHKIGAL